MIGLELSPTRLWTRAGNAGRLVTRHVGLATRRRLRRVPIEMITDEFGFSLAPSGWHPFVALLDGVAESDDRDVVTDFERFFRSAGVNAARNLNDVLDLSDIPLGLSRVPQFWLGTYPWGGLSADEIGRPGPAFGWAFDQSTGASTETLWGVGRTVWYRPDSIATLANERLLTVDLAESVRTGYRPLRARGFPRLTVLRRADGRYRAIIVDGHHRLAALAHLGATRAVAEVEAVIDEGEADAWFYVRSGHCSAADALRIFDAFFQLDGSERFDHVSNEWTAG